jgi:hypothetical protein
MKNFLELLAINLKLNVVVNGIGTAANLHEHLIFDVTDIVTVDGIEVLPQYHHLANNGTLTIAEPFYNWYHRVSGQGWLLIPNQG